MHLRTEKPWSPNSKTLTQKAQNVFNNVRARTELSCQRVAFVTQTDNPGRTACASFGTL